MQLNSYTSRWNNKNWTVVGDSNTELNWAGEIKYPGFISEDLGLKVQNLGKSGSGWFNTWKAGYEAFYLRLDEVDKEADLITFLGGGNDYAETEKSFVLGTLGDTDPVSSFYGALDHTISTAINMFPNATIATFTQFRRDVGQPTNPQLEAMVRAELEVTAKYGIPCFNLYHQANQYPWLTWYRERYMIDGIHLNDAGHKKLAFKMIPFIEGL